MTNTYRATKIISDTLGVLTTSAENAAYRLAKAGYSCPTTCARNEREKRGSRATPNGTTWAGVARWQKPN